MRCITSHMHEKQVDIFARMWYFILVNGVDGEVLQVSCPQRVRGWCERTEESADGRSGACFLK